jgi:hypothetical protein
MNTDKVKVKHVVEVICVHPLLSVGGFNLEVQKVKRDES